MFETHVHNDYVTGGFQLARRTGASYVLATDDEVDDKRTGATDGDEFAIGRLIVRALHTLGRTPTHLSYAVLDAVTPVAVFAGGSMLYGTVGRTDLIDAESTETLTRAQFRSVRHLVAVNHQAVLLNAVGFYTDTRTLFARL